MQLICQNNNTLINSNRAFAPVGAQYAYIWYTASLTVWLSARFSSFSWPRQGKHNIQVYSLWVFDIQQRLLVERSLKTESDILAYVPEAERQATTAEFNLCLKAGTARQADR